MFLGSEQYATPLITAIHEYVDKGTKRFHVPGHKGGTSLLLQTGITLVHIKLSSS